MLSIKILGPGCSNCQRLHESTLQAVQMLGVEASVEKVTDYSEFLKYKLLATPGLVINERLVCAGRIPDQAEIVTFVTTALSEAPTE